MSLPPIQTGPVPFSPSAGAPEIVRIPYYGSNDTINRRLFGTAASETLAPDLPVQLPSTPPEQPAQRPELLTTPGLLKEMTEASVRRREAAEHEGMSTPRFGIIGGQVWGETTEQLMEAVAEYVESGQVPAPFGDGVAYTGQLLRQSVAAGVQPILHVAKEVREHPTYRSMVESLGLDPGVTFATDNDLGGLLDDLAPFYREKRKLLLRRSNHEALLADLKSGKAANEHGLTGQEVSNAIGGTLFDIGHLNAEIAALDAAQAGPIRERLLAEDRKIAEISARENASEETDAVIDIMPKHTPEGSAEARTHYTDPIKDVDGLSTVIQDKNKIWREATPRAMLKVLEYLAPLVTGTTVGAVSRKQRWQMGKGPLVGNPLSKLPGWRPREDRIIDGREQITTWVQDPSSQPVAILMSAVPAAKIIKADKFNPGNWGLTGQKGKLLIIDGGCKSVKNPETGQWETHGNLDPDSLPTDGSVVATSHKKAVGTITAAIVIDRVIESAILRFGQRVQAAIEQAERYRDVASHRRHQTVAGLLLNFLR